MWPAAGSHVEVLRFSSKIHQLVAMRLCLSYLPFHKGGTNRVYKKQAGVLVENSEEEEEIWDLENMDPIQESSEGNS